MSTVGQHILRWGKGINEWTYDPIDGAILATIQVACAAPVNVIIHPRRADGRPVKGHAAIARVDEETWRVQPMAHHQRLPMLIVILRGSPPTVSEAFSCL